MYHLKQLLLSLGFSVKVLKFDVVLVKSLKSLELSKEYLRSLVDQGKITMEEYLKV